MRGLGSVVVAAGVGSSLEWFDFFIASLSASLAWPFVFFPKGNHVAALALSISTYAVIYFTRPFGAFIFGHFGDRIGRREMLVATLLTMGLGSLAIGLTPSYGTVGPLAPVLVAIFRAIQGIGLGGEFGGASTWVTEFASKYRYRSLAASAVTTSGAIGITGASSTFLLLTMLPRNEFLDYGWRIAFYIGAAVAVVGVLIRYRLSESLIFLEMKRMGTLREPALEVLRREWKKILMSALSIQFAGVVSVVVSPYALSFLNTENLTRHLGLPSYFPSLALAIASGVSIFTTLLGGLLGDLMGRRSTILLGAILTGISCFPLFLAINSGDPPLIILAFTFVVGSLQLGYGPVSASFAERYNTRTRYSGSGLSYQFFSLIQGLIILLVVSPLVSEFGTLSVWPYVALTGVAISLISVVFSLLVPETKNANLMKN